MYNCYNSFLLLFSFFSAIKQYEQFSKLQFYSAIVQQVVYLSKGTGCECDCDIRPSTQVKVLKSWHHSLIQIHGVKTWDPMAYVLS